MKKVIMSILLVVGILGVLIVFSIDTVKEQTRDLPLQLEIELSDSVYRAGDPIDCKAILSYVGEENSFKFYSGEPVVMFAIGGDGYFNGELDLLNKGMYCYSIERGTAIEYPFKKYIGNHFNSDENAVDFWREFSEEKDLVLKPGEYEIFARCSYSLNPGDEFTTITVSEKIIVK